MLWSTERRKGKCSPYSIIERRVPELIPVLGSQPAGDVSHKPSGRLPLLSERHAVALATLESCYQFRSLVNRGTMGVNSLPKTVTRHRRGCDLNPSPSAPESSTLTTRLPSHCWFYWVHLQPRGLNCWIKYAIVQWKWKKWLKSRYKIVCIIKCTIIIETTIMVRLITLSVLCERAITFGTERKWSELIGLQRVDPVTRGTKIWRKLDVQ